MLLLIGSMFWRELNTPFGDGEFIRFSSFVFCCTSFHIFRGVWCHGKTVFFKKFKFIFVFLNYFNVLI
jgi:hypothetical protein